MKRFSNGCLIFILCISVYAEAALRSVAAATRGTYIVTEDGALYGWGHLTNDLIYKVSPLEYLGPPTTVSPTRIPTSGGKRIKSVSLGGESSYLDRNHENSCLVFEDGSAQCWGSNRCKSTGMPQEWISYAQDLPPLDFGTERVVQIAIGTDHRCVLFDSGKLKCWGVQRWGELGQGMDQHWVGCSPDEFKKLPPVNLGANAKAISLAVGYMRSCALLNDGQVKCWGLSGFEPPYPIALGDKPEDMGENLKAIDLGSTAKAIKLVASQRAHQQCVLFADGRIKCWGDPSVLGIGATVPVFPLPKGDKMGDNLPYVNLGLSAKDLECGGAHCCAILENNALKCWGSNHSGQLGLGDQRSRSRLDEMGDELPFVDLGRYASVRRIWLGTSHTCAELQDTKVKCWGANEFGQLGNRSILPLTSGVYMGIGTSPDQMGDNLKPVLLGSIARSY